jgi:hypothetical protein
MIKRITRKIFNRAFWIVESFKWRALYKRTDRPGNPQITGLSIGVITFMDRFESTFGPLVDNLARLFPNNRIIVNANGHVKQAEQAGYLQKIREFCSKYDNVELIPHQHPRGLSFLWNQVIRSSPTEHILILNDDLKIGTGFYRTIKTIDYHNLNGVAVINNSWSHFIISKGIIGKVGWFDEGLKEIGGEDDDYCARLACHAVGIKHIHSRTITSRLKDHQKKLSCNSYGRNMLNEKNGYSTFNSEYLETKWQFSEFPFDGAVYVPDRKICYWKLRD